MEIQHAFTEKDGSFYMEEKSSRVAEMHYVNAGDDKFIIDHTVVDPAFEGKGLGKQLVAAAVEYARSSGKKIMPLCPYAKAVLHKTEAYRDVLY